LSSLYISEFSNLPITSNGVLNTAADAAQWLVDQRIAIGATSAASNAFNAATQYVLLSADSVCSVAWAQPGVTPTATASNLRIPPSAPRLFGVRPGRAVVLESERARPSGPAAKPGGGCSLAVVQVAAAACSFQRRLAVSLFVPAPAPPGSLGPHNAEEQRQLARGYLASVASARRCMLQRRNTLELQSSRRTSSGSLAMLAAMRPSALALMCAQGSSHRPRANQGGWLGASSKVMVFVGAPLASLAGTMSTRTRS
jgi:hypothetical protein